MLGKGRAQSPQKNQAYKETWALKQLSKGVAFICQGEWSTRG
jgi:hypothetical protein